MKADVIDFDSGFKEHLGEGLISLALFGFLCALGIQFTVGRLFSSFTFSWNFFKIKSEYERVKASLLVFRKYL